MINIDSLQFSYKTGSFHVSIPDLSVEHFEKVAIIGPSGSGKTTLLNLISGIFLPQQGTVSVNNVDINRLSDSQRRALRITSIGFIFQDFKLLDYLNVMDNILHPFRITSALTLTKIIQQRAEELAEQIGIYDKLKSKPKELSQGEKQRVAICRALLTNPQLILADEATGNLDPQNKTLILDQLFNYVKTYNATLIAVTHDHELLVSFDRVIDFKAFYRTDMA